MFDEEIQWDALEADLERVGSERSTSSVSSARRRADVDRPCSREDEFEAHKKRADWPSQRRRVVMFCRVLAGRVQDVGRPVLDMHRAGN